MRVRSFFRWEVSEPHVKRQTSNGSSATNEEYGILQLQSHIQGMLTLDLQRQQILFNLSLLFSSERLSSVHFCAFNILEFRKLSYSATSTTISLPTMVTNIRFLPRTVGDISYLITSKRISYMIIRHPQQRPSSAAAIALRASARYPAHKLIKNTSSNFIGGVGRLTERETAQLSQVLPAMEQRKQSTYTSRQEFCMGWKYAWKFAEASYLSFSLFLLCMATLDWATGWENLKGGKAK